MASLSPETLEVVQQALDALVGTNADFGFFYRDDASKVYTCSIRLLSGALAYGTGPTTAAAHLDAMTAAPIRRAVSSVAA